MKFLLLLSVASIPLAGCATYSARTRMLCEEMATFANSTPAGEEHAITLETSWGPSKLHPDSMSSRDCTHNGYEPGKRLCEYLVQSSAEEFYVNNFLAAQSCISNVPRRVVNYVDYHLMGAKVSAYSAHGVRDDVEVSVELGSNDEHGTITLTIGAKALMAR